MCYFDRLMRSQASLVRARMGMVERAGHLCKAADDGQQAVDAYLRDPSFDVVLMGAFHQLAK